ncbi:hypothetical protein J3459_011566 [Metarhizium acridum]|uniref:Uncharacterized protein n=1 Tax=Metarhizium acridum (strain CQMa 102) TaxID=655827 RepID=E9EBH1_METAQ|nr:uncharacterized protein MAC_07219 [Metarhizium acridum CQMa 102]EFY86718.1 hypothetical protein MAC_07219 [Metarhizium acridum CQMa 102]KAG8405272.1 hypothetical protein J3458_021935 [Metarhizium acridum]KAG8419072.1 hypothetical protein J3459_011566 [Metarhizium acridum]
MSTPKPQTPSSSSAASLQNDIPPLTTLLPAIFVPVTGAFFTHTPPATRAAQIRESMAALETHSAHVRANILALTEQECRRISRDAEIQEARAGVGAQPPPRRRLASAADKAAMVANMQAAWEPSADRELPRTPDFSGWLVSSPREWGEREVLRTVARTMADLKGFGEHVARVRGRYEEALQREERRERERELHEKK